MDTYKIILEAHSGIAYIALFTVGVAAINALIGLSAKNEFKPKDRRIALFGLIAAHIQFVIGLILYFVSPKGFSLFGQAGMKEIMGNSELRQMAVEHPIINILAIVFITIGWSTHKRAEGSNTKFKKIAIFFTLGLLLLLSRIPWNVWFS